MNQPRLDYTTGTINLKSQRLITVNAYSSHVLLIHCRSAAILLQIVFVLDPDWKSSLFPWHDDLMMRGKEKVETTPELLKRLLRRGTHHFHFHLTGQRSHVAKLAPVQWGNEGSKLHDKPQLSTQGGSGRIREFFKRYSRGPASTSVSKEKEQ